MEWFRLREWFTPGKSQGFLVLLAGLLVSVFAGILLNSTPAYAADATWDTNGNISKDGITYKSVTDKSAIQDMGLPSGGLVFASDYDATVGAGAQTVSTISFPSGANLSTVDTATHTEFSFSPPSTWSQTSQAQTGIVGATFSQVSSGSNCNIDQIGWMVCGPSVWIANGVDTIYGWIEDFLTVQELEVSNQSSTLYQAWDIMRAIANAAFIIAFMVIIYSHITSYGITNYGLKKLVPRLVVAAILVNISFYICAIAIDLSNVLGHTLKQLFDDLYNSLTMTGEADNDGIGSTSSIIQAAISGGVVAVGGGIAVGGSILSATPLILPLLLTVFVALLVALVVFAARQALVVILTIIAPLAFVCYILPGTEKWFEKWRSTFFTMLFFFPAFAVVFGGAKLAGMLIITNASTIVMVIIGWAVQLAPLALAPLVLKLGGGILNRVAGIVNDPSKGIIDKSRQWAQDRSKVMAAGSRLRMEDYEKRRDNQIGADGKRRGRKWYDSVSPYGAARRMARYADTRSRRLKDQVADSEKGLENSYHNTKAYQKQDLRSHLTNDLAEATTKRNTARYEDLKSGKIVAHGANLRLQEEMMQAQEDMFATDQRTTMAKASQSQRLAELMQANTSTITDNYGNVIEYRTYAGGVLGESGAAAALANAIAQRKKAHDEGINEMRVIQEHFKLTGEERQRITQGKDVVVDDDRGHYTFSSNNADVVEAAGIRQQEIGTFKHKLTTALGTNLANIADSFPDENGKDVPLNGLTHEIRAAISEAAARNGIAKTAVWMGGKAIEDMNQGTFTVGQAITQTLAGGKVKEIDLSSNDADALAMMYKFDRRDVPADKLPKFDEGMKSLRESAWRILHDPNLRANASDSAIKVFEKYAVAPPPDTTKK